MKSVKNIKMEHSLSPALQSLFVSTTIISKNSHNFSIYIQDTSGLFEALTSSLDTETLLSGFQSTVHHHISPLVQQAKADSKYVFDAENVYNSCGIIVVDGNEAALKKCV